MVNEGDSVVRVEQQLCSAGRRRLTPDGELELSYVLPESELELWGEAFVTFTFDVDSHR